MVKGDVIVFKLKMPFQDRTETFVYLGKIEGEQIAFGRRPEDLTIGQLVNSKGCAANRHLGSSAAGSGRAEDASSA